MNEREQMYAAILADPENDTLRLGWADWLDAQDVPRVKCRVCDARKKVRDYTAARLYTAPDYFGFESEPIYYKECTACDGTGTVPDTSDADRAALIRVQVAISNRQEWNDGDSHVEQRERQLLAAHPDWSCYPCPTCKGGAGDNINGACLTCNASGDLLIASDVFYEGDPVTRILDWHAGYPRSVRCTLVEVGWKRDVKCERCNGDGYYFVSAGMTSAAEASCEQCAAAGTVRRFVPSTWAAALVKALPVTRFVTEKEPYPIGKNVAWYLENGNGYNSQLPLWAFETLPGYDQYENQVIFDSIERATNALAIALGQLVRGGVK